MEEGSLFSCICAGVDIFGGYGMLGEMVVLKLLAVRMVYLISRLHWHRCNDVSIAVSMTVFDLGVVVVIPGVCSVDQDVVQGCFVQGLYGRGRVRENSKRHRIEDGGMRHR